MPFIEVVHIINLIKSLLRNIFILKLFLVALGLCCCEGLCLVRVSGGYPLVVMRGLLTVWSLLLQSTGSRPTGSVAAALRRSCPMARGILPDKGSKLCPLHWQADS